MSTSFETKEKEKSSPKEPHEKIQSGTASSDNQEKSPSAPDVSSPSDVTPSTSGLNNSDDVVAMDDSAVAMGTKDAMETDSVEEEFASRQFSKIEDYTMVYEKHSLVSW